MLKMIKIDTKGLILRIIIPTIALSLSYLVLGHVSIEHHFGWLPAIIISGMMFSLYHLGYPGFRTFGDLLLLFVVGIGFAIAYKLSNNNLLVSYFVNLPNAFVTYMLKHKQFPTMYLSSTITAVITLALILIAFYVLQKQKIK